MPETQTRSGLSRLPFETGVWAKRQSGPMKSATYHFHFLVPVSICLKLSHRQLAKGPNFAKFEGHPARQAQKAAPVSRTNRSITRSPNHQSCITHHAQGGIQGRIHGGIQ
jgi:hypothetical protein